MIKGAYVVTWNGIVHCARPSFDQAEAYVTKHIVGSGGLAFDWERRADYVWAFTPWNLVITYCDFSYRYGNLPEKP